MSHEALIEDLRAKSRERVRQYWADAETKVAEFRQQKKDALAQKKREMQNQLENDVQHVAAPILHEAQRVALNIEDDAMRELSDRLYALAVDMLPLVREKEYDDLFAELVGEIPSLEWQKVRVNPVDEELARSLFPDAKIIKDDSVLGGFEVSTDDGRFRVANLLQKRLEKGWRMALPELLEEIIGDSGAETAS